MPRGNYTIQRSCEECGKIFTPPTLVSKYCCPACSKRAYKKRQVAKEKEAIRQALIRRIPSNKGYLTVKEAMLIYGISKDVLYRMIRQGLIPSYNFGQRLIRLSRQYIYLFLRFFYWMNTSKQRQGVEREKRKHCPLNPKTVILSERLPRNSISMTAVYLSTYAVILFLHAKSVTMFMFPNLKLINYTSRYEESIT